MFGPAELVCPTLALWERENVSYLTPILPSTLNLLPQAPSLFAKLVQCHPMFGLVLIQCLGLGWILKHPHLRVVVTVA